MKKIILFLVLMLCLTMSAKAQSNKQCLEVGKTVIQFNNTADALVDLGFTIDRYESQYQDGDLHHLMGFRDKLGRGWLLDQIDGDQFCTLTVRITDITSTAIHRYMQELGFTTTDKPYSSKEGEIHSWRYCTKGHKFHGPYSHVDNCEIVVHCIYENPETSLYRSCVIQFMY